MGDGRSGCSAAAKRWRRMGGVGDPSLISRGWRHRLQSGALGLLLAARPPLSRLSARAGTTRVCSLRGCLAADQLGS